MENPVWIINFDCRILSLKISSSSQNNTINAFDRFFTNATVKGTMAVPVAGPLSDGVACAVDYPDANGLNCHLVNLMVFRGARNTRLSRSSG